MRRDLRRVDPDLHAHALGARPQPRRAPPAGVRGEAQSHDTAELFGLHDRGVLAPGKKADLNMIDLDGLRLRAPEMIFDLPAGGKRFMQRAEGYRATIVSGELISRERRADRRAAGAPGEGPFVIYDPYSRPFQEDPYPLYKRFRDEEPCTYNP